MVSSKERLKLSRLFDQQAKAIQRQKDALTRMTLMLTEGTAALMEIADSTYSKHSCAERARAALDRMEVIRASAAATTDDGEESNDGADDSVPTTEGDAR